MQVQVHGARSDNAFDGTAEWSLVGSGLCAPFVTSQGAQQEIIGTRLHTDPGACQTPASSLTQKFGSLLLGLE